MKHNAAGIAVMSAIVTGRCAAHSHTNWEYELNQVMVCPRTNKIVAIISLSYIV
jgi:hypothetical protein